MRPHVICHMLSSVDGRTLSKNWHINSGKIFEETAATIKSNGWLVGRKTMSEFSSSKPRRKRAGRYVIAKKDYVAPHTQKTYAVALDARGALHWKVGHVDTEHVVVILSKKVTAEYLDHLQRAGVSYIFAGDTKLDLKHGLEKLNRLFNIERITLQGGGTNNGSFLNAGLIDELSLVIVPDADGTEGTPSVFDIDPRAKKKDVRPLKLKSFKIYKKVYVWLRYSFT